ncbi:amidohydrolase family protein [Microbacterium sp. B19]|uniref:amidohydrolase family protein n=1 Tax=Microbacterium sp. B19 TaxID=96765 RepID=UPI000349383C|nr:amidohydrolase family protein [Microbacterium sp. B19]
MNTPSSDEPAADAAADRAGSRPTRTRRQFLWGAGLGALTAGAAIGVGMPLIRGLASTPLPPRTTPVAPGSLRIDHVTVVDPRDGSRDDGVSILIRDGRIIAVGDVASLASVPGVQAVDGEGRFAVPGYNNMHSHALQAQNPALMMATMLAEGVTGMRQMLGTSEMLAHRAANRLPLSMNAPRLLAMPGDILTPFNAGSVDAVQKAIDAQYDAGADFIKMVLTDRDVFFAAVERAHAKGLRIAGHLPESVLPSEASAARFDSIEHLGASDGIWIETSSRRDELWATDDTGLPLPAWIAGLPGVGEIYTATSAKKLINPAAFDSPEAVAFKREAVQAFDEGAARALAATFVKNDTWHAPTLVRLRTQYLMDDVEYEKDPWLSLMTESTRRDYDDVLATFRALPDLTRESYREVYDAVLRVTKVLHDEGVPMMAATDGQGKAPGQRLQLEFQELAKAGIRPLDILRMATTAPARYLGRTATMGVIAPGADADLLLLASDPTVDVAALGSITAIVRDGHFLPAEDLDALIERLAEQPEEGAAPGFPTAATPYECC